MVEDTIPIETSKELKRLSDSEDSDDILKFTNSTKRNTGSMNQYSSIGVKDKKGKTIQETKGSPKIKTSPKAADYQTFGNTESESKAGGLAKYLNDEVQADSVTSQDKEQEIKLDSEVVKTTSEDTPILFLDVNFGKGNVTRIVMYENDTPEELAKAFCKEHGLDENKKTKLIGIIQQHLASVLDKIDEQPSEE